MTLGRKKQPFLSIIIPVLNEAETIGRLLSHLDTLESIDTSEIIVVDGDPDGKTIKAIEGSRIIKKMISQKGRALQMNAGAGISRGKILLFLHADTMLPVHAINEIRDAMQNHVCVGGAFDLGIDSDRFIFRIIERAASLRSRLSRVPFGDQAIFLDRQYFLSIGGYHPIPVMEDVDLMTRIRKNGDSIHILSDKIMTSPRRWEKEGIVRCTMRNWVLQILFAFGISPVKLARYYKNS